MRNPVALRNAGFFVAGGFAAVLFIGGTAHAITDKIFAYSAPKTGYYGLDPARFVPNTDADQYSINAGVSGSYLYATNGTPCLSTGVNLPQGAKVTAIAAWYSAANNAAVGVGLFRNSLTGTGDYAALLSSSNASQNRKVMSKSISNLTIDNKTHTYSVFVCFNTAGAANVFYGARLTYTYDSAGD